MKLPVNLPALLLFLSPVLHPVTSAPTYTSPLCHITSTQTLNFDDAPLGFLDTYRNLTFPGTVDWLVIGPTSSPSLTRGVISPPNALLSAFHSMTFFSSADSSTFDLVSLYITALTATPGRRGTGGIEIRVLGWGVGGAELVGRWVGVVEEGEPRFLRLGARRGFVGVETVGIEARLMDEKEDKRDVGGGFVLDDLVVAKRKCVKEVDGV